MYKSPIIDSLKIIDNELKSEVCLEKIKVIFFLECILNVLVSGGRLTLTKNVIEKLNNTLLELSKRLISYTLFNHLDKVRIYTMSYGCITKENAGILSTFLKDKRTLEVFAGNGYLSRVIKNLSPEIDYLAIDNKSSYLHTEIHLDYGTESIDVLSKGLKIKHYDVIVMNWAPRDNTPLKVLKRMKSGQTLIHCGEWDGCTANKKFYNYLSSHFINTEEYLENQLNENHVPRLWSKDSWSVMKKI